MGKIREFLKDFNNWIQDDNAEDDFIQAFKEGWKGKNKEEIELQKRREALEEQDRRINQACYTTPPIPTRRDKIKEEQQEAWDLLDPQKKAEIRMQYINNPCSRPGLDNAYGAWNLLPEI